MNDVAPPLHAGAMAEALRRAPSRGGWLQRPDLPADYRGPTDRRPVPFGTAGRDRPALASLVQVAARLPDAVAFADQAGSLTYRALVPAVARLAGRILAAGGEGPVGLVMPASVAAPVGLLACLAARRPALLLDAALAPARAEAMLARAGARLVVGPAGTALAGLPLVPLDAAFDTAAPGPLPEGLGHGEPAFIIGTSGSTGEPKLVVHAQRGILHQVQVRLDCMRAGAADRYLMTEPPGMLSGLTSLLLPLHGCAVDILSLNEAGLGALQARLRSHPPTILRAGPSLLRLIARMPDATRLLSRLRVLRVAGEAFLRADLELAARCLPPGCVIYNRYGATEMAGLSWFARPEDDHDPFRIAVGLPDTAVEIRIVDETGAPCRPGEAGELWMRGRHGALGDWTADGIVPGRLEPDQSDPTLCVHRTGDLARLTPDGVVVVLGRLDRMVKVNGQRVELAEVEAALRSDPAVREAAVIARDQAGRVSLHAFVVPATDGATGLEQRLRRTLRERLPGYMVPAGIALVDALPLLRGGKLDERALAARLMR